MDEVKSNERHHAQLLIEIETMLKDYHFSIEELELIHKVIGNSHNVINAIKIIKEMMS